MRSGNGGQHNVKEGYDHGYDPGIDHRCPGFESQVLVQTLLKEGQEADPRGSGCTFYLDDTSDQRHQRAPPADELIAAGYDPE